MSEFDRYTLRLVIQHIEQPGRSVYRLVAYGDGGPFRPVEFPSRDRLLQALAALPAFKESTLSIREEGLGTRIVFTGEAQLDGAQLAQLGLSQS